MALSRLAFEYASEDPSVQNLLPSLLKTVLLLSDDPSREVVKSLVGFVRVSIVAMTPEQLQPLLPDILNGLLKYHRGKDRFRAKIKIIIKKLVKLFGFEALMPLVPESDSRLLTHMRKLSDREARRKSTRRDRKKSEAVHFDEMVASDEDDSDDGRTLLTSATRMSRMTNRSGKQTPKRRRGEPRENTADSVAFSRKSRSEVTIRLKNDNDGNVFDVMDLAKKTVRFTDSPSEDSDSEGPIEFDVSGKLVVPDSHSERHSTNQYDDNMSYGTTQSRIKVEDSAPAKKIPQKRAQKLGSSYKAKKAGGDVKKKGQKYDPYAYVPLDGRSYTKKNRHHAVEQMGAVVQKGRKRQKRS
jgi:ribosomal RNA-processing protein 12